MTKTLDIESPVSSAELMIKGAVVPPNKEHAQEPVADELPELKRKPRPEVKSKRVSFLFRPSIYKNLGRISEAEGVSINALVNDFLEASIKRYAKANAS